MAFRKNLQETLRWMRSGWVDPDERERLKREQLLKKNRNITEMVNEFNKKFKDYKIKLAPSEVVDGVQQYTLNEKATNDESFNKALKKAKSNEIKVYTEDTGEDTRAILNKGLKTTFNTDGKVTSNGVATANANSSKAKLLQIPINTESRSYKLNPNKNAGATRWVGVNSEWRDRYGRVIAPHIPETTESEVRKVDTHSANTNNINITEAQKRIKLDEQYMKGWTDPRTAQMRLQNPSSIPSHLLNTPIPDYNPSAIKDFDILSPAQMKEFKNLSSNKVTAKQRMQGAGKAAAGAVIDMMISKLTEPDPGEEGANRSGGAITGGGHPWEEFYAPSFYA